MRALSRNSKWTSKKYEQGIEENDWAIATPKIEATHPRISLDSESSTTELVTYQNLDVQSGDKLLVKLSNGSYQEVVVESVTKNNPAGTIAVARAISSMSAYSSPDYWDVTGDTASAAYGAPGLFSNDGTKLWSHNFTALNQYNLATPYDVSTISSPGISLSAPFQGANNHGYFFAKNGRYIFMGAPTYTIHRYTLATPYDISTAYNLVTKVWGTALGNFTSFSTGAASEDGLKIVIFAPSMGFKLFTMEIPFDLTSLSNTDYGLTNASSAQVIYYRAFFLPNGKDMIAYFDDVVANAPIIKKVSLSSPFDISSISETTLNAGAIGGITGNTNNNGTSRVIYSEDLRNITILSGAGGNYNVMADLTTKLNTPTRIDISSAGLSEIPSEAILVNDLKGSISFGNISARTSCITEQLWLENSTTTTSSAVVGHIESGKLEVGDTIILNNTDAVVLTGVTETLNGLPYINLDETDGNKLLNVASVRGGNADTLDIYSGPSPKMTFSPDGKKLFIAFNGVSSGQVYSHGISCWNLPTPWDTTTLIPDARGVISATEFGFSSIVTHLNSNTANKFLGIQFSEDGTRMFTFSSNSTADFKTTQSELAVPWDPYTITSSWISPDVNGYYHTLYTTNQRVVDMYIDNTGTSLVVTIHTLVTNTSNAAAKYIVNISPWDITSITADITGSMNNTFNVPRNEAADLTTHTYRGAFERFNSDKSIVVFCGSGGTADGFGTGSMKSIKDNSSILNATSAFPLGITLDGAPSEVITDAYISEDGTKFYALCVSGLLYEYQIRAETLQKYAITFASQAAVPASIHIDKKSSPLSLTPTVYSLNSGDADVTWDSPDISMTSRRVQIQVEGASVGTEVTTVRIDLESL